MIRGGLEMYMYKPCTHSAPPSSPAQSIHQSFDPALPLDRSIDQPTQAIIKSHPTDRRHSLPLINHPSSFSSPFPIRFPFRLAYLHLEHVLSLIPSPCFPHSAQSCGVVWCGRQIHNIFIYMCVCLCGCVVDRGPCGRECVVCVFIR
jgi:hypothetical protein